MTNGVCGIVAVGLIKQMHRAVKDDGSRSTDAVFLTAVADGYPSDDLPMLHVAGTSDADIEFSRPSSGIHSE